MPGEKSIGGYHNRILRVNLTTGEFTEESLSDELIHDYIGGRGFGAKLLYDDLKPGIDPMGEENELIFTTGPITKTSAQYCHRWKATFKSPLTGGYFTTSAGGHFAAEQKAAGYDVIIVTGKAEKPVYLWIQDGKYEIRDATYLWGLDCDDTHTLIREELNNPRVRVACIGPAGENGVKIAGIFTDRRAAGRGGGGAVMGSKNLKALVIRGNKKVDIAEPDAYKKAVKEQVDIIKAHPGMPGFSVSGTQTPELLDMLGIFPVKNFQEGVLSGIGNVDTEAFNNIRVRKTACYGCMVHCGSIAKINSGKYRNAWAEGPEYETIWAFAGATDTPSIGLTVAADKLCDDLGLDTISTGGVIAFAYELYERGIIDKKDTEGLELNFGNEEPILELIKQIAYRDGLGDLLAEGSREAARRIGKGADEYAMHVKGLELPAYDPRGAKAQGLNLLTSNMGAQHNSGYSPQELFGVPAPVDRFSLEGKGELTKANQDITTVTNTGIICNFLVVFHAMTAELYAKILSSVTGIKDFADPDYLMKVGERIFNLERMFNVREGFGRKDDSFPKRITDEPLPDGPSAGQVFELDVLLDDYYEARGWDKMTGIPSKEKLNELGLGFTLSGS